MNRSTGFTLIEVLVALTLAGFVLLAVHQVFVGVADGAERLEAARSRLDREANARWLLAWLAGSIEVGRNDPFSGEPHAVAFTSWVTDSLGHRVRRRAALRTEGDILMLSGLYAGPVALLDSLRAFDVDYLLELGANERFVRRWYSDAGAPAGFRLRITWAARTDTLLLLVGSRG